MTDLTSSVEFQVGRKVSIRKRTLGFEVEKSFGEEQKNKRQSLHGPGAERTWRSHKMDERVDGAQCSDPYRLDLYHFKVGVKKLKSM